MTDTAVGSPTLCFDVEVVRLQQLSPCFIRLTFGGACLEAFDDGGDLGPRDQRIKVIVPASEGGVVAPVVDFSPGWYPRWLALDPAVRGEMRTYTVRRARHGADGSEVDIDFVLHVAADGTSGPAAAWASSARVGDRVVLMGPRRGRCDDYGGIEWSPPAPHDGPLLLVGDETAVPAVASILESLPAPYAGRAILEVPEAEDFLQLRTAADIEVTWLARAGRPHGSALAPAVHEAAAPYAREPRDDVPDVDPDTDILWETPAGRQVTGTPYVWVAGEAAVVRALRRHLVAEVGLPRANVAFMGYWREGRTL